MVPKEILFTVIRSQMLVGLCEVEGAEFKRASKLFTTDSKKSSGKPLGGHSTINDIPKLYEQGYMTILHLQKHANDPNSSLVRAFGKY